MTEAHERAALRAARCFHSLEGHKAILATVTLLGLKRLGDAFDEHLRLLRQVAAERKTRGIATIWVPADAGGPYATDRQVRAACAAVDAANPSLEGSLALLWPGAQDGEVAAAWRALERLDLSTAGLVGWPAAFGPSPEARSPAPTAVDVLGTAYEVLKHEFGLGGSSRTGEFFTPESLSWLMAELVGVERDSVIGDPTAGSARLLAHAAVRLLARYGLEVQVTVEGHPAGQGLVMVVPPSALMIGQDIAPHGPAMGRITMTALGYTNAVFVVRNTLLAPVTQGEVARTLLLRGMDLLRLQPGRAVDPSPSGA